ncbi:hypothetical protein DXU92_01495 [Brachybacterium saurashtrense]|uniref:Uncharacterized protein n=1 Tax=Brachybacterium saurashtrense TaxID=556288 RepID=A0A345YPL4_9MICO|nr:hypothetical protein DWV08_09750 [Brachybacterium saurashtrense]RRR24885.1 hypothetical protein DXU92_01495 [Brachybacterium saurashtrense]
MAGREFMVRVGRVIYASAQLLLDFSHSQFSDTNRSQIKHIRIVPSCALSGHLAVPRGRQLSLLIFSRHKGFVRNDPLIIKSRMDLTVYRLVLIGHQLFPMF